MAGFGSNLNSHPLVLSQVGNPLWEDDIASMCFNPVKNFQIAKKSNAWFQARHIQTFNSGTAPGTHWKGKLGTLKAKKNGSRRRMTTMTLTIPPRLGILLGEKQ